MTELKNFLDQEGRLTAFPAKRRMKLLALFYLAGKFDAEKTYTEKEVNELLNRWHTFGDPATLRRELFTHRFIDRERSGKSYWLEPAPPSLEDLMNKYS